MEFYCILKNDYQKIFCCTNKQIDILNTKIIVDIKV